MIHRVKVCPACSREFEEDQVVCPEDGAALINLDTGASGRDQDLVGTVVDGRYRLERIVGRGGMGTVFACRHVVVGKSFAMKVLRAGVERSDETLQRFIREAQAANAIGSRHICEMTDFGQLPNGAFYVVMELLQGISLTKALREKRLEFEQIKKVFGQIAVTLQRAHERNIIHRDLKPDNVILVPDEDDPYFVKLLDFGIAKILQHEASDLTETGVILGTPYYMSPEQARGDPLDHRSDIYSLGVMMYRAFTGRLPFVADTAMGVLTRHLTEEPELPSRLAEIDSVAERVILRCMEKQPIDRFQSMTDVAEALQATPAPISIAARPTLDEHSANAALQAAGYQGSASAPPSEAVASGYGAAPLPASPATSGPPPDTARPPASGPSGPGLPGGALAPPADVSPASLESDLVPGEAFGEAATNRGLAAAVTPGRPGGVKRWALLAVGASVMIVVGGLGAFLLLRTGTPQPPETSPAAVGQAGRSTVAASSSTDTGAVSTGDSDTASKQPDAASSATSTPTVATSTGPSAGKKPPPADSTTKTPATATPTRPGGPANTSPVGDIIDPFEND